MMVLFAASSAVTVTKFPLDDVPGTTDTGTLTAREAMIPPRTKLTGVIAAVVMVADVVLVESAVALVCPCATVLL